MKKTKKNLFKTLIIGVLMSVLLVGCGSTTDNSSTQNVEEPKIAYECNFYTNDGNVWFRTVGSTLDIKPNKVKQWGYNTDGTYTSWYETSSIVSVYIDDNQMDSCGSTAIFADTRLVPCDVDFRGVINEGSEDGSIDNGNSRFSNYYALTRWWIGNRTNGNSGNSRLIIVMSQTGEPITMYEGNRVTWSLGELPKTTMVMVDGLELYIHRANFAVIDTNMIVTDMDAAITEIESNLKTE